MNKYKPTGWKYEPSRHSLAAKGIKTRITLPRKGSTEYGWLVESAEKESVRSLNYAKMDVWIVEFEGGAVVSVPALSRENIHVDKIMRKAREMLQTSPNFDVRRQSMGRIVRTYKKNEMDFAKMSSTELRINKLIFNPSKDAVNREILTIQVPESKEKVFDFLKAYTKFPTEGKWKKYHDNNIQFEVEYKDSTDDKYGRELLNLLENLNKEKIGEEKLYARTIKVDESTLED